jgi:membrane protease YdiL (CAAX protease family)
MVVAGLFSLIHLPALVLVQEMGAAQLLLSQILLFSLAMGNGILMLRVKNLIAPIMAHSLWGVTVFLFR